MTDSARCAIYARFSSEKQNALSIDQQIRKCREYADRHNFCVLDAHLYADEAISGAADDRDGLRRLLTAAKQKPKVFDMILCDDTSRLSRKLASSLGIFEELQFAGVRVIFVAQGIDTSSEQAEILVATHGIVDSLYIKELARKTFRGVEQLALNGLHTGGRVFGYRRVPIESETERDTFGRPAIKGVRLEIDPDQAVTIRRIFESYATGHSFKRIAIALNNEGVLSPQPQKGRVARSWCPSSVHHILHNERYRGVVVWGKTKKVRTPRGTRVYRRKPEGEWLRKEIPEQRIVSDELWKAVTQRMKLVQDLYGVGAMSSQRRGRVASSPHIFTGLLKCFECGGSVTAVSGTWKKRGVRYGCSIHAYRGNSQCTNGLLQDADELEQKLLSGLQKMVLRPDVVDYTLKRFEEELKRAIDSRGERHSELSRQKVSIEAEIYNCVNAIAGGHAVRPLTQKISELESRLAATEEQLAQVPRASKSQILDTRRFVTARLSDLHGVFKLSPRAVREEIARHLPSITLTVENGQYVATGFWDWLGRGGYSGAGGPVQTDRRIAFTLKVAA